MPNPLNRSEAAGDPVVLLSFLFFTFGGKAGGGGDLLPYMAGYIGMCRCEGYDFQAVYSGIGYINQRVWGLE